VILLDDVAEDREPVASLVVAHFITEWADGRLVSRDVKQSI